MSVKNSLTNEQLNQRFDNPFALVTYAIKLARARVERGEGIDSNPANDVLELIAKGHDLLVNNEEENEEDEEDEDLE
jgi:hypothetical protein